MTPNATLSVVAAFNHDILDKGIEMNKLSNIKSKNNTVAIVEVRSGEPVTTTIALSDGAKIQHKNIIALVREYLDDLNEFGRVAFQTRSFATKGGSQEMEYALLNEAQSTLLITYMRNTEIVRAFKKRLVDKDKQSQPRMELHPRRHKIR